MYRKQDRQDLQNVAPAISALRVALEHRDKKLQESLDLLLQSHAALAREFEQIGGFIQHRVKPLTEDEKFDWAKNIMFMHGYVAVQMEDAQQAKSMSSDAGKRSKPPEKSPRKSRNKTRKQG